MRRVMLALLAVSVLLCSIPVTHAQTSYGKILIGKWEGDVQVERGRSNPNRTLIIESVGKGRPRAASRPGMATPVKS